MLYAILICTDEGCAEEFEVWAEPDELEALLCDGCGCVLQALAFSEVEPTSALASPTRLRDAA
jgi:hypothetical protein